MNCTVHIVHFSAQDACQLQVEGTKDPNPLIKELEQKFLQANIRIFPQGSPDQRISIEGSVEKIKSLFLEIAKGYASLWESSSKDKTYLKVLRYRLNQSFQKQGVTVTWKSRRAKNPAHLSANRNMQLKTSVTGNLQATWGGHNSCKTERRALNAIKNRSVPLVKRLYEQHHFRTAAEGSPEALKEHLPDILNAYIASLEAPTKVEGEKAGDRYHALCEEHGLKMTFTPVKLSLKRGSSALKTQDRSIKNPKRESSPGIASDRATGASTLDDLLSPTSTAPDQAARDSTPPLSPLSANLSLFESLQRLPKGDDPLALFRRPDSSFLAASEQPAAEEDMDMAAALLSVDEGEPSSHSSPFSNPFWHDGYSGL